MVGKIGEINGNEVKIRLVEVPELIQESVHSPSIRPFMEQRRGLVRFRTSEHKNQETILNWQLSISSFEDFIKFEA